MALAPQPCGSPTRGAYGVRRRRPKLPTTCASAFFTPGCRTSAACRPLQACPAPIVGFHRWLGGDPHEPDTRRLRVTSRHCQKAQLPTPSYNAVGSLSAAQDPSRWPSSAERQTTVSTVSAQTIVDRLHVSGRGSIQEDADVAFACGMIAHHQGAIDMAEVLLEHGDDPQMRALAEEIIAAQGTEIERMTTWLAENAN